MLNTTAHELLVDIGSEVGARNAAESGESLTECIALEVHRVRQRLAVQIWRDYQDHINARIRFADPDEDDKRRHELARHRLIARGRAGAPLIAESTRAVGGLAAGSGGDPLNK